MLSLVRAVNAYANAQADTRIRAAITDGGLTKHDRRSSDGAERDLAWSELLEIQSRALYLRRAHPLVSAYDKIMGEWVAPHGSKWGIEAEDERIQELADRFMDDPDNILYQKFRAINSALASFGEVFLPAFYDPSKRPARVAFGYTDPHNITEVKVLKFVDPVTEQEVSNHAISDLAMVSGKGSQAFPVPIIRGRAATGDTARLAGHLPREMKGPGCSGMLVMCINNLPNQTRGLPDAAAAIDGMAGIDSLMASTMEGANLLSGLIGDVTMDGEKDPLNAAKERYGDLPGYAGILYHNDREHWNLEAPKLGGQDIQAMERLLRGYYTAPFRIPGHVLASDMSQGNRAVAESATDPAFLHGRDRQQQLKAILTLAFKYQIDTAALLGQLPAGIDESFSIDVPEIRQRDMAVAAAVFVQATSALSMAEQNGWLGADISRRVLAKVLDGLGVEATAEDLDASVTPEPEIERDSRVDEIIAERLGRDAA